MKCVGKTRFDTEDTAATGLKAIRSNPAAWERDKIPQRYYSCKICSGYHLTAMPPPRKRKKGVISG
jgi:hypothetical protein